MRSTYLFCPTPSPLSLGGGVAGKDDINAFLHAYWVNVGAVPYGTGAASAAAAWHYLPRLPMQCFRYAAVSRSAALRATLLRATTLPRLPLTRDLQRY